MTDTPAAIIRDLDRLHGMGYDDAGAHVTGLAGRARELLERWNTVEEGGLVGKRKPHPVSRCPMCGAAPAEDCRACTRIRRLLPGRLTRARRWNPPAQATRHSMPPQHLGICPTFEEALEACREALRNALPAKGTPAARIPIRWPQGPPDDRRLLQCVLETEFRCSVIVVASEDELPEDERAAIAAARNTWEEGAP